MPIQIRTFTSRQNVDKRIREYEAQFSMSSNAFSFDEKSRATVPEFDAIEWNFLLMQRDAMKDDDACGRTVFLSGCKSNTSAVDTATMYESVAA